ncbi:MAG: MarC family protein [Rhodoblastus sp.]
MDPVFAVTFLGALFAIMNPFVNLPIFLGMTSDSSVSEQRRLAILIFLYSSTMCAVISLLGGSIITFFGISIDSFRVAGGMVLLGIALSMLNGQPVTSQERAPHEKNAEASAGADENDGVAFYPMTFPMIVGPGSIATLIVYAAQAKGAAQYVSFVLVLVAVLLSLLVVFYFASGIGELLSAKMRVVMSRIMGMILATIAVQMIAAGAKALLPGLA